MSLLAGILIIVMALFLQAFFAGTEIGLISCNRIKIRHLAEKGDKKSALVDHFLRRPQKLFGTTLVGANLMMVAGTTIMSVLVFGVFRRLDPGPDERIVALVTAAIMYPLNIIFGQVVPMSVFQARSNLLSRASIRILNAAGILLTPAVVATGFLSSVLASGGRGRRKSGAAVITREDLRFFLRDTSHRRVIHADGREMIRHIFDLGFTCASDIRVPLSRVTRIPLTASAEKARKTIIESGFSRIPVTGAASNDIVGLIEARDLIWSSPASVREIMRPILRVQAAKPIDDILTELQRTNQHMALVIGSHETPLGILTIEDIIEEIVGEIEDEYETGQE